MGGTTRRRGTGLFTTERREGEDPAANDDLV